MIPYLHNISEMKDGDSKFLVHILYRQITAAIVFAVKLLTSAKDHVFLPRVCLHVCLTVCPVLAG